jgi:hypothetical protein
VAARDDVSVHRDRDTPVSHLEKRQQLLEVAFRRNAARFSVYIDPLAARNGAVGDGSFLHPGIVASRNTNLEGRSFDLR